MKILESSLRELDERKAGYRAVAEAERAVAKQEMRRKIVSEAVTHAPRFLPSRPTGEEHLRAAAMLIAECRLPNWTAEALDGVQITERELASEIERQAAEFEAARLFNRNSIS